jgi:hypothetical protein
MTTTYDITTNVGQVRLKIGDTDTTDAAFTDEELTLFLTDNGSNINLAAADACEAWAAKYATNADREQIGDYSYAQSSAKKLRDLAATFRARDEGTPYFGHTSMDLTAGSAITDEED